MSKEHVTTSRRRRDPAGRLRGLSGGRLRALVCTALVCAAPALAACGSGDSSSSTTGASTNGRSGKPVRIAFLDAAQANTYLEATYDAMQKVAREQNAEITVFDAAFDAAKQQSQLQNVLATKQYDGIVIVPLNGPAIKPLVEQAIAQGIKVGSTDLPIGSDFATTRPEVAGLAVAALRPALENGRTIGELTLDACRGLSPCNVAYLYGLKSVSIDLEIRRGFDEVTSANRAIDVIAEAEGRYDASSSLRAMQNILQAHPDVDVLVAGGDQMALGAEKALDGKDVKIIGIGGSIPAVEAIKDGRWFGTAALLPADEGRIAMEGVLADVRDGTKRGGVDPVASLSNGGRITPQTAGDFNPQWKG